MWFHFLIASAAPTLPEAAWNWDEHHRFFIESEVQLPERLWLEAEFNKNVRAVGWQLQVVLDCASTDDNARRRQISCKIEDLGLRAATLRGDQGHALPVLEEYDQVLTGAVFQFDLRPDGRIAYYEVQGVPTDNLRTRGRLQTMRLLLRPLAVALEVQLPLDGESPWFVRETQLCQYPTMWGTLAPVEGIAVGTVRGTNVIEIASSARGTMSPGQSDNLITCDTSERAFFTLGLGIARHTWEMYGDLTPGSPGSIGITTIPFTQRGQLVRLKPDEHPSVMTTEEYVPEKLLSGALGDGPPPPSR